MIYRLILLIFFVSGALSLGYQVLWSKYLVVFIGASAYSYATVLASFMGGLAIGSAVFGRVVDRVHSPLRLFAALEAGVGIYAVAYPSLIAAAASSYASLAGMTPAEAGAAHGLLFKALVAGALLLPPTILMGGTFPAVLRHVTDRLYLVGRRSAQLYAANAAGAVVGTLGMAFAILPSLGLRGSLVFLALLNSGIAVWAFALSLWPLPVADQSDAEELIRGPVLEPPIAPWVALALITASGALAFAYEVAWTRYFGVVLGSSTYSFAVMLAAFIGGIALGSSLLGYHTKHLEHPIRAFGICQLLVGLLVLGTLPLCVYLPWALLRYSAVFSTAAHAFGLHELGKLLLCLVVLLPSTILLGTSLPLVLSGSVGPKAALGWWAGRVYAWNTVGSVIGALAAGMLLLPALGTEDLLRTTAIGSGVIGFVALWLHRARTGTARVKNGLIAGGLLAIVTSLHVAQPAWKPEWFTLAAFRRHEATTLSEVAKSLEGVETLFFEDDVAAQVQVYRIRARAQEPEQLILLVDGKPDASSIGDMPTQLLLAHVPLLLKSDARNVLVIGLGSGATAGAALTHPIERLDVVELLAVMPRASQFFTASNGNPLADPRCRLIIDDARSYLTHTTQDYDLIISEPSNPWMAGIGSLFSAELYAEASERLRPDGVYLQWLQAYEMGNETFATVLRTFRSAFPWVYVFQGNAGDMLLLGARQPLLPSPEKFGERLARKAVRAQLERLGILDLATLLTLQVFSPATVDEIVRLAPMSNTDDNLLLEHSAPRDLFARARVTLIDEFDERLVAAPSLLWNGIVRGRGDEALALRALGALGGGRASSRVVATWQMAAYLLLDGNLESLEAAERSLLPNYFWSEVPPRAQELALRIDGLLRAGRDEAAALGITTYSGPILVQSVLSPTEGNAWRERSADWVLRVKRPTLDDVRRFRIELLSAMGDSFQAGEELRAWVTAADKPKAEWAVITACRLDAGTVCMDVRRAFGQPQ